MPGSTPVPLWMVAATGALLALKWSKRQYAAYAPASTGRGRDADVPSDITAPGWKDILWRVYESFSDDRVLAIAAGVTYFSLLSIFPATAALVSIYGLFTDAASLTSHLAALSDVLPSGAIELIREQVTRVASQGRATLGVTFLSTLALSLWSANAGMKALVDALNVVYGEKEKRGFFKLNAVTLTLTLGAIAFLLVALAAMVVLPLLLDFIGLGGPSKWFLDIGRWPALLAMVALALAVLYRFGPSRETARWHWISWGSGFAAVAWLGLSMLFSWYAENMGSYNETYGSLGAVVAFMVWIWISMIVVLIGAELNAEMEHQTARDTTTGAPLPLGARGAHMADTIGPARQ